MRIKTGTARRFSPLERAKLLKEYHKSGMTQRAFANQRGVSLRRFVEWLGEARKGGCNGSDPSPAEVAFVEIPRVIRSDSSGCSKGDSYYVEFGEEIRLEVPRGFAVGELAQLCQTLRSL